MATPTAAQPTPTLPAAGPKRGGNLRAAHAIIDPSVLDVLQSTTSGDYNILLPIYDGLVIANPDRTIAPGQAASWEFGSDGLQVTFRLVEGMQFHDGTPFNAEAVKSDLDWKRDPQNLYEQRGALERIERVDVLGEYSFRLNLSKPDAALLSFLAVRPGFVFSPTRRESMQKPERQLNPAGAGHFKVKERVTDSHVLLERWDKAFSLGKYPYLDSLTLLRMRDPAVKVAAYRAGSVDIYLGTAPEELQSAITKDPSNVVTERWATEVATMFLNPRFPPLDNVNVRRALAMLIDREAIVEGTLLGRGVPVYGFIGPAWPWAWDAAYSKYKYNPEAAKALLAQEGYSKGFSITPVTWARPEQEPIMVVVKDALQKANIDWGLVRDPGGVITTRFRIQKDIPVYFTYWGTGAADIDQYPRDWFHSKSPSFMYQGYLDPAIIQQIDALLDSARATIEPSQRAALYRQVQEVVNEHALAVFAFQLRDYLIRRNVVRNFTPAPGGFGAQWHTVWLER